MVESPAPRRGEVWYADVVGDKPRPVLVLTRDPMGARLNSVICAPITSKARGISTEVPLGESAGLAHASVANCDNIFLLGRSYLVRRLGAVSDDEMAVVCTAVARAIGCVPRR